MERYNTPDMPDDFPTPPRTTDLKPTMEERDGDWWLIFKDGELGPFGSQTEAETIVNLLTSLK